MTQYLLSVHMVEGAEPAPPEAMQASYAAVDTFNDKLQAEGLWIFAGGLHPIDTATVVSNETGDLIITDGPFGESKEHIGGFWIIEAPDLDAALQVAAEGSKACGGPVEVRPFQSLPES